MTPFLHHCPAPAKLNLFLHITGQRPDGYHLLQTVFQLVDLADKLHFTLRTDGQIRRVTAIPGIEEKQDLTVRAAYLLQTQTWQRTGKKLGVDIAIEKCLPAGGGLGGGSSDAATTLMALNHLWQTGLTSAELMQLGLCLGADVPFFIFGRNAFAEGIGEILTPVETQKSWYIIIDPGIAVPTSAIFASEELTRNTEKIKITDFLGHSDKNSLFGKNDLQSVAEKYYPPVAQVARWLNRQAKARMTGSGACLFAPVASEKEADDILRQLPKPWKGWKTRGLKKHPLKAVLKASGEKG